MDASNITGPTPAWLSATRNWLAEHARLRRDADEVSRMDAQELRVLGFSHTAAVASGISVTRYGPVANGSWIHAQPSFRGRASQHC